MHGEQTLPTASVCSARRRSAQYIQMRWFLASVKTALDAEISPNEMARKQFLTYCTECYKTALLQLLIYSSLFAPP